MINTSDAYKSGIDSDNREFCFKLLFTFINGTSLTITDKRELMCPGLSYDGATSSTSSFDIGSAIITKMDISLNNDGGKYDAYTWTGASVAVWVGLVLADKTELLKIGTYYVDKAVNGGVTKVIKCLGALALMDKDYTVSRAYPATVYQAYYDACTTCGVLPEEASITCGDMVVANKPDGVTCREIVGYTAMLSGGVACENPDGKIFIKHYSSTSVMTISKLRSRSIEESDITISGIQVTYGDSVYQSGTDEYMLAIGDNPLITSAESAQSVAATALVNLLVPFRPMSVTTTLDPSLQPGDRITVETKGKVYHTYATSIKWTLNGSMTITCGAKTESDQQSDRYGAVSKTIIKGLASDVVNEAIKSYDLQMTQLNALLTNAMGYYETTETLEDGSKVSYAHDKPTLAESQIVYKRTVDGFGYSTDGGKTYTSGWTADGNILAKVLTAIGINADWIRTGDLTVGGSSANADGSIRVYDADNRLICSISKAGFDAISGALAGWKISGTEITSPDGTANLSSATNSLRFYSSTGVLLMLINSNGVYNYDSSGKLRNAMGSSYNTYYDAAGTKRITINADGFNQYSTDGTYLGHLGRSTVYAVDSSGAVTDEEVGEILSVSVEDAPEALGWAVFAVVPGSGIDAKQRRVYYCSKDNGGYQADHYYVGCETQMLRHTETDPYYAKKLKWTDTGFTLTVGTAGTTTRDITNDFEVTEDGNGNVTAITNKTTGRQLVIE